MTYIEAESNRSRITCIMVVAESDWMRIQNLPDGRIWSKKKQRPHTSDIRKSTPLFTIKRFFRSSHPPRSAASFPSHGVGQDRIRIFVWFIHSFIWETNIHKKRTHK